MAEDTTLPMTERELLIRLDERSKNMKASIENLTNTATLQIAKMDTRLIVLETFKERNVADDKIRAWNLAAEYVEKLRDDDRVKAWNETSKWVDKVRGNLAFIGTVITVAASVAAYFIGNLLQFLKVPGG